MPSEEAIRVAVQVWCKEETKHIVMDWVLVTAFAEELDRAWAYPRLRNATTGAMLEALRSRVQKDGSIESVVL